MTDINTTKWKPFIKLTLAGEGSCNGFLVFDVNSRVTMMYDDDAKVTFLGLSDDRTFCVKETPDEICALVDAKIDEQIAEQARKEEEARAKWEADKAAWEAQIALNNKETVSND